MRFLAAVVAFALLTPSPAAAQAGTSDGIQALIRGDYPTAARILRPLAEDTPTPDPLAQFFMAALYQHGLGVVADDLRACRLFRAAATPANVLMRQSLVLAAGIHQDVPVMLEHCPPATRDGGGPAPSAFTPGADHGVILDGTGLAAGVDAWARGDYQRAAEILQPLAETRRDGGAFPAFFLATLYDSGRGVPLDPVRACALYSRSDLRTRPFNILTYELRAALVESLSMEQLQECSLLATYGFDHGFHSMTFTLEPGHLVSVDGRGATITYEGRENRIDLLLGTPGAVFLPARYTELTAGRPQPIARHFIEFFLWTLVDDYNTWSLTWFLYEVIRDDLVSVTIEELTKVSAERPPMDFDISEMARLRVTDAGDAEWAVLSGTSARSEIIETDAERQETRDQARAREEAERKVDWTRAPDPYRTPALNYSDADGCADLFVYGWSADRTEAITMRADKNVLQLSTAARTFDLASQGTDFELLVHVFGRAVRSWPFCTDVGSVENPPEAWRAIGGTVTIELSPPGVGTRSPHLYRATIRVVGAEFVNATGGRVRQVRPITLTALVGSYHG